VSSLTSDDSRERQRQPIANSFRGSSSGLIHDQADRLKESSAGCIKNLVRQSSVRYVWLVQQSTWRDHTAYMEEKKLTVLTAILVMSVRDEILKRRIRGSKLGLDILIRSKHWRKNISKCFSKPYRQQTTKMQRLQI
jgi:hypothetical protein